MKIKLICFTTYFSNLEIIQIILFLFLVKTPKKQKRA